MLTKIKINNVGKVVDFYIEENLATAGLPSCLGRLGIPIVHELLSVDSDEIFKNKHLVPEGQVKVADISSLIHSVYEADILTDMVLDNAGANFIEDYKKSLAQKVVDQLKKCVNCEYIEKCHKITQNYLDTLCILKS